MQSRGDERSDLALSRREMVGGGTLLLGMFLLTGCNGSGSSAGRLPDTYWGNSTPVNGSGPNYGPTNPIAKQPAYPSKVPPIADTSLPPGVMTRSQWTSKGVARPNEIFALNGVNRITIHHDGMAPTSLRSQSDVQRRLEQIRSAHVNGRGWADIAYHYIIDPSGRVWEGRSVRYQGAHVKDQNENNLGIMVLGNFDRQSPSSSACSALDRFVAHQMARYRVPMSRVRTHQELSPTECPGRNLQRYMVQTRSSGGPMAQLAASLGVPGAMLASR